MLHDAASATKPTSPDREVRRQQLRAALQDAAVSFLDRLADTLVDLPDDQVFGDVEHTLRDLGHQYVARAHQAGIDAGKKRGTRAPASSAPTAPPTPASS